MLVGAAQIAIAAPLHAQERQVDFDIPAQELSKSLREFAATTDMDLLYPPQLVENRQARAVKGAMTPSPCAPSAPAAVRPSAGTRTQRIRWWQPLR